MRLQTFAAPNDLTIVGDAEVRKDNLARYYIDGARIAIVSMKPTPLPGMKLPIKPIS